MFRHYMDEFEVWSYDEETDVSEFIEAYKTNWEAQDAKKELALGNVNSIVKKVLHVL